MTRGNYPDKLLILKAGDLTAGYLVAKYKTFVKEKKDKLCQAQAWVNSCVKIEFCFVGDEK